MSAVHDIMDPVTSALVGRDAELEQLCSTLGVSASATDQPRSAVLLAGDAGVGKTRLLTELRDLAVADGWQVLAGHCLDFGDSALPYLPFSEVIGPARRRPPRRRRRGRRCATPRCARLQPGRRMLSRATDPESVPADRRRPVRRPCTRSPRPRPRGARCCWSIEDLHWADQSTRDLLSFLFTRGVRRHPVAIVASYRSDDLHRRHPLRRQVAEWSRLRGVERIQLEPAAPTPTYAAWSTSCTHDPLPGGARPRHRRPGRGQRVLRRGARAAPARPARAAPRRPRRRAAGPTRPTRRRVASGGPGARPSPAAGSPTQLLGAVVGLSPVDLDQALRDAVEAHVLVPSRRRLLPFRHALLAEAVYDDLLPGERVRLHASYAEALREGRGRGHRRRAGPARAARQGPTPPRSTRASAPATRRWGSVAPRRRPTTTSRRSSCGTTPVPRRAAISTTPVSWASRPTP